MKTSLVLLYQISLSRSQMICLERFAKHHIRAEFLLSLVESRLSIGYNHVMISNLLTGRQSAEICRFCSVFCNVNLRQTRRESHESFFNIVDYCVRTRTGLKSYCESKIRRSVFLSTKVGPLSRNKLRTGKYCTVVVFFIFQLESCICRCCARREALLIISETVVRSLQRWLVGWCVTREATGRQRDGQVIRKRVSARPTGKQTRNFRIFIIRRFLAIQWDDCHCYSGF